MGQQGSTEGGQGAQGGQAQGNASPLGMMKAWVMEMPGAVDGLSHKESVNIPAPGVGEARVRVMAAGLSHRDVTRAAGTGMAFPAAMGLDGSGVVDALGPDTDQALLGTRVHFTCDPSKPYGSLAEFTVLPAKHLYKVDDSVSFTAAASLPTAAWAAYVALYKRFRVQDEKDRENKGFIFINGGAGGVGGFAIDLATKAGLTVIASCSSYNAEHVRVRGAAHVIDYTADDIVARVKEWTEGAGVGYLIDLAGFASDVSVMDLLAPNGQLCLTTTTFPEACAEEARAAGVSIHYLSIDRLAGTALLGDVASEVMRLTSSGAMVENVGEVGRWDSVREGLQAVEGRHVRGKLVIDLQPLQARRDRDKAAEPPAAAEGEAEAPPAEEAAPVSPAADTEAEAAPRFDSSAIYRVTPSVTELTRALASAPSASPNTPSILSTCSQTCRITDRDGDVVKVEMRGRNLSFWVPLSVLTKVDPSEGHAQSTPSDPVAPAPAASAAPAVPAVPTVPEYSVQSVAAPAAPVPAAVVSPVQQPVPVSAPAPVPVSVPLPVPAQLASPIVQAPPPNVVSPTQAPVQQVQQVQQPVPAPAIPAAAPQPAEPTAAPQAVQHQPPPAPIQLPQQSLSQPHPQLQHQQPLHQPLAKPAASASPKGSYYINPQYLKLQEERRLAEQRRLSAGR